MQKKKIVFIVNPISGTRSKDGLENLIKTTLDSDRYEWSIVKTQRAGHAVELAADCVKQGVDICVAVGGDGTVNEVARSLVHSQTVLGIVPCGSGNGLARHLRLSMNMKRALQMINTGEVITCDYGVINDQPFFCTCGLGFDAHVSLKFAQSGKRGLSTYAKMVMKEGMSYQPATYTIAIDGGEPRSYEAFLVDCANAAQYGNNTYIAPGASIQDGVLDLVIVERLGKPARAKLLTDLFMKTASDNRHLTLIQGTRFQIHRDAPGAFQIDGDPLVAGTDFDIHIEKAALRAICNPRQHEDKARPNKVVKALSKLVS